MPITAIMSVTNDTSDEIMFVNTEFSGNNRRISPGHTVDVSNCWVPWCRSDNDFPAHHIHILDEATEKILWYIWQDHNSDGDHVRCSSKGWLKPSSSNQIPGESGVGQQINVTVFSDTIKAYKKS